MMAGGGGGDESHVNGRLSSPPPPPAIARLRRAASRLFRVGAERVAPDGVTCVFINSEQMNPENPVIRGSLKTGSRPSAPPVGEVR